MNFRVKYKVTWLSPMKSGIKPEGVPEMIRAGDEFKFKRVVRKGVYKTATYKSVGHLTREEFERLLRQARLYAPKTQVDPIEKCVIQFERAEPLDVIETFAVVPYPACRPRRFTPDPANPFGLVQAVEASHDYMMRAWVRVRRAVINTYAEPLGEE